MKLNAPLFIYHAQRRVATLDARGLCYDPDWLADPLAFPLSHQLPKQKDPLSPDRAWPWLVNLLPEGDSRKRIAARLQLSQDNDLGLLAALGRDCAGAVQIYLEEQEQEHPSPGVASYNRLDAEQLQALATRPGSVASLLQGDVRMSLAGAQDKIPVRRCEDGSLWLPRNGAPSTHLLKCPNPSFAQLVANEHFCLSLAEAVGLWVAASQIITSPSGERLLLLERFDRSPSPPSPAPPKHSQSVELPWVERLHQEDFAQALGRPHYEKYQSEGGPGLAECVDLLRRSAKRPVQEIPRLIRWFVFCLIIGNRDNHAKNLARLFEDGHWTLAPFYDLVCTRAYDGIAQSLAMTIGEQRDINRVNTQAWQDEAKACRLGTKTLLREVQDMCQQIRDKLTPTRERVEKKHALEASCLDPVLRAIHKGLRATERDLY